MDNMPRNSGRRERLLVQGVERQLLSREDQARGRCCAWYAERLPTVEINNTFYRMPKTAVLENWAARRRRASASRSRRRAASRTWRGSRRIGDRADSVAISIATWPRSATKRGPVLFQLPPILKKDLPRLHGIPRPAARRSSRRVRVPQRHLVRRRRLRRAARGRRGAVPVRARGQRAAAAGRDGALGLRAPAPRRIFGRRSQAAGSNGSRPRHWRDDLRLLHARADRAGVCAGSCSGLSVHEAMSARSPNR